MAHPYIRQLSEDTLQALAINCHPLHGHAARRELERRARQSEKALARRRRPTNSVRHAVVLNAKGIPVLARRGANPSVCTVNSPDRGKVMMHVGRFVSYEEVQMLNEIRAMVARRNLIDFTALAAIPVERIFTLGHKEA